MYSSGTFRWEWIPPLQEGLGRRVFLEGCWQIVMYIKHYGGIQEQKSNIENAAMATNMATKCQAGSDKCVYVVNNIFASCSASDSLVRIW